LYEYSNAENVLMVPSSRNLLSIDIKKDLNSVPFRARAAL
jgi:hypothetical protein